MKTVGLYIWWSESRGDGDGYDSEMEVTNEQYKILSEYDDMDLEEIADQIEDEGLSSLLKRTYEEEIDALIENSDIDLDSYADDYQVWPDDEEFWDLDDNDEDDIYEYRFQIAVGAGESFVDYDVTREEKELIYKAIDNCDDFCDVEELSDLFERVEEAAKEKLEEDLELTGDEDRIDVDELEFSVNFDELPEYEPRYAVSKEGVFRDLFSYGVKINCGFDDLDEDDEEEDDDASFDLDSLCDYEEKKIKRNPEECAEELDIEVNYCDLDDDTYEGEAEFILSSEYDEENCWTIANKLSVSIGEDGRIDEISFSSDVTGDDGLGDCDPEDYWTAKDFELARKLLKSITTR